MKFITILLFILTFSELSSFGQANYIRTNEYGNLQLSVIDLKKIVSSIEYYANKIPIDTSSNATKAYLTIECRNKGKAIVLILTSFEQLSELHIDGEEYTDIDLDFSYSSKPISGIKMKLNNFIRVLSVTGTNSRAVEALYRDIDNQLQTNESKLSSIDWALVFLLVLICLFVYSIIIIIHYAYVLPKERRNNTSTFLLIVHILIFLGTLVFFFWPITCIDIFPRFLFTAEKELWYVKHAPIIAVIGILGVLGTFSQIIIYLDWKVK